MKHFFALLSIVLFSAYAQAMDAPKQLDHSSCMSQTVAFVSGGTTFYREIPALTCKTSHGHLYLCQHAKKAAIPELPINKHLILCDGEKQYLYIATNCTTASPLLDVARHAVCVPISDDPR